jgi:hypothetical protein
MAALTTGRTTRWYKIRGCGLYKAARFCRVNRRVWRLTDATLDDVVSGRAGGGWRAG